MVNHAYQPSRIQSADAALLFDDNAFDRSLPRYARVRSRQYWTPVAVAAHAARIFEKRSARKILDVGCGPGKFCIAAASRHPELELHGVDRRRKLIRLGVGLARQFAVDNVRLFAGDATRVSWGAYDGFYFFNPFAENAFERHDRFDEEIDLSTIRFIRELRQVEKQLTLARSGTVLVTYHGLGGPIPATYELVMDEKVGTGRVRTWLQRQERAAAGVWLETAESVIPVSNAKMQSIFASLLAEDPEIPPSRWPD